jgi:hypothetical protein
MEKDMVDKRIGRIDNSVKEKIKLTVKINSSLIISSSEYIYPSGSLFSLIFEIQGNILLLWYSLV